MGKKNNNLKVFKRTVKYIAVAPDQQTVKTVLKRAPDGVIQAIANAALNARSGDVLIPPQFKALFRHHHRDFDILTNRRVSLKAKRQRIQRGGALPIIVPLIATVLGSLGGEFISRLFHKNE
jgi:hypothetical protein